MARNDQPKETRQSTAGRPSATGEARTSRNRLSAAFARLMGVSPDEDQAPEDKDVDRGAEVANPDIVELRVALLTEEGTRRDEEHLVVRAVWLVAVQAILAHRSVLPEKGTALLGMAAEANLIDRIPVQKRIGG